MNVFVEYVSSASAVVIGNNPVHLRCTFLKDNDNEDIYDIYWQREMNKSNRNFENIAVFSPTGRYFDYTSSGMDLRNRSSLTDRLPASPTVVLSIYTVKCEDDRVYRCYIRYRSTDYLGLRGFTSMLSLTTSGIFMVIKESLIVVCNSDFDWFKLK